MICYEIDSKTMKKNLALSRLLVGLLLTFSVSAVAVVLRNVVKLDSKFFPNFALSGFIILILAVLLIVAFRKQLEYRISVPKFNQIWKPVLFGLLTSLVINILTGIITTAFHGKIEGHPALMNASVLQFVLFTLILAPVAEEHLFRGFLQNYLKPLGDKGITVFHRRISLPVLIAAMAFSLSHLGLLASGVGTAFMIRTALFTFILGTIAGYYQEKYNNIIPAILVHMAGNLMGMIPVVLLNVLKDYM